jgi:hypothetical protein
MARRFQLNSLIVTCRLHELNPYDNLIDVLRRNSVHPNHARVPAVKESYAANLRPSGDIDWDHNHKGPD